MVATRKWLWNFDFQVHENLNECTDSTGCGIVSSVLGRQDICIVSTEALTLAFVWLFPVWKRRLVSSLSSNTRQKHRCFLCFDTLWHLIISQCYGDLHHSTLICLFSARLESLFSVTAQEEKLHWSHHIWCGKWLWLRLTIVKMASTSENI